MDRLSPLDALFLHAEDADRHASMALASIAVFEGPPPAYEEFVEAIARRIPQVPGYRRRLREVPFDLGPPVWVDDERFDVRWHVRQTALPPPGDDAALRRLIGRVMTQRMDRDRPLWEYWLVTGLAEGRWALISKLHHSMVDGVSAVDIYRVILDPTPEPPEPPTDLQPPDRWQPKPGPRDAALAAGAVRDLASSALHEAAITVAALRTPAATARQAATFARGLVQYATALVPARRSSMAGPVGTQRRFTWARATRADVDTVRRAFGGTLNDVVLAAITNGFRELLLHRGEEPRGDVLRSLVPVSVRAPGEEGIMENRVSSMLAELPVQLAEPVDQLAAIRSRMEALKESREADAGWMLTALAGVEPFPAFAWPARFVFAHPQRMFTTVTTNVPGPRRPLFALGRPLVDLIPYVPIGNPVRVGVSIITYADGIRFGITADWDTVPDVEVLAAGIEAGLRALVEAAAREVIGPPVGDTR